MDGEIDDIIGNDNIENDKNGNETENEYNETVFLQFNDYQLLQEFFKMNSFLKSKLYYKSQNKNNFNILNPKREKEETEMKTEKGKEKNKKELEKREIQRKQLSKFNYPQKISRSSIKSKNYHQLYRKEQQQKEKVNQIKQQKEKEKKLQV
ncbi:hypothetical protein M0812_18086 [Anaeramoeba flamelloides]|uniref:Uncharacterized protein n=1 Tax=Anaeramoeba flamelloides TaxID=1746091 RepID=A0AAV7Z5E3_9EUKA|nr:hypothetical protein M0812_18086 [Anaeramoeba flamelloides]